MSEEQDNAQRVKELYETLDETIRELSSLTVSDKGLVTDWMTAVAVQAFDDEGNMLDIVEMVQPNNGVGTPRYRALGLLEDLRTQLHAITGHVTLVALHQAFEEDDEGDE